MAELQIEKQDEAQTIIYISLNASKGETNLLQTSTHKYKGNGVQKHMKTTEKPREAKQRETGISRPGSHLLLRGTILDLRHPFTQSIEPKVHL